MTLIVFTTKEKIKMSKVKTATEIIPLHTQIVYVPFTKDQYETSTKGGIIIITQEEQQDEFAQNEGILIAYGDKAFHDWSDTEKPKVGDRIYTTKYPGLAKYINGQLHRICDYRDVLAFTKGDK